ncbi:MAG: thioesterase family protein, partial [Actinomycetota bacterium]|nr:thioesterase family protein [Actinomycetota bacterium]
RLEQRVVTAPDPQRSSDEPGDGRTIVWTQLTDVIDGVDAAALAVMGDFVPFGVAQALGTPRGGNSLDNTLRLCRLVPTEWVLLDIQVQAVERGFGHGL